MISGRGSAVRKREQDVLCNFFAMVKKKESDADTPILQVIMKFATSKMMIKQSFLWSQKAMINSPYFISTSIRVK